MNESCKALQECIDLQIKKSRDYQNPNSSVKQADYYPRGLESIYDMLNTKMLRMRSIMDGQQHNQKANFESLEDSAKDLINYASFFVAYGRHGIDGQKEDHDLFNRPPADPTHANSVYDPGYNLSYTDVDDHRVSVNADAEVPLMYRGRAVIGEDN
jgi:hypothetical protein